MKDFLVALPYVALMYIDAAVRNVVYALARLVGYEVYCHPCSQAASGDMPVHHLPPACLNQYTWKEIDHSEIIPNDGKTHAGIVFKK